MASALTTLAPRNDLGANGWRVKRATSRAWRSFQGPSPAPQRTRAFSNCRPSSSRAS